MTHETKRFIKTTAAILAACAVLGYGAGAERRDADWKQQRLENLGFHNISLSRMWSVRAQVVTPDGKQRCTVFFDEATVYYEGCWAIAQPQPEVPR